MVKFARGYYLNDSGEDIWFYMGGEPPEGQFIFRDGKWEPLGGDGFHLADRLIDGDPDYDGPVADPPEGVPPYVRVGVNARSRSTDAKVA